MPHPVKKCFEAIDSLNGVWDDIYASAMNDIVAFAFSSGAAIGVDNEANREVIWDIIEEQHFVIPEDKASLCFEQKFNFNSLRKQISENEEEWMDLPNSEMSANPYLNQDLPEEYWTLVTPSLGLQVTDVDVSHQLAPPDQPDRDKAEILLGKIKMIVDIVNGIIQGINKLSDLLKDCAGSTVGKDRHIRDGIPFDGGKRMIGYEMEQRGVLFDGSYTQTKIKGKAKIYKVKNNGKKKKDRKENVGITFCAKEWNVCDSREWPSDAGYYEHPLQTRKKKVKTGDFQQPYALGIEQSIHYLRFKFYGLNQYVDSKNLFGTTGCN